MSDAAKEARDAYLASMEPSAKQKAAEEADAKAAVEAVERAIELLLFAVVAVVGFRGRAATRVQARHRGIMLRGAKASWYRATVQIQTLVRWWQARLTLERLRRAEKARELRDIKKEKTRLEGMVKMDEQRVAKLKVVTKVRSKVDRKRQATADGHRKAEELISVTCDNDIAAVQTALRGETTTTMVNLVDGGGWSALMWAASLGHLTICEALLRHEASVGATDKDGWTALLLAADRGRHAVVGMLLAAGADPAYTNRFRKTANMLATSHGHKEVLSVLRKPPELQNFGAESRPESPSPSSPLRRAGSPKSPSRIEQRQQRPSLAAQEFAEAISTMGSVGMHQVGSAGWSTIMRARKFGPGTVVEAMLAFIEHHGVQHFGIEALTHEVQVHGMASLPSVASLSSALLQAINRHIRRTHDIVIPGMALACHCFLPIPGRNQSANDPGLYLAQNFSQKLTAAAAAKILQYHIDIGRSNLDYVDTYPHTVVEDLLALLLAGCRSRGHTECRVPLLSAGCVPSVISAVVVYRLHSEAIVRMGIEILSLLVVVKQDRYSFEQAEPVPAVRVFPGRLTLRICAMDLSRPAKSSETATSKPFIKVRWGKDIVGESASFKQTSIPARWVGKTEDLEDASDSFTFALELPSFGAASADESHPPPIEQQFLLLDVCDGGAAHARASISVRVNEFDMLGGLIPPTAFRLFPTEAMVAKSNRKKKFKDLTNGPDGSIGSVTICLERSLPVLIEVPAALSQICAAVVQCSGLDQIMPVLAKALLERPADTMLLADGLRTLGSLAAHCNRSIEVEAADLLTDGMAGPESDINNQSALQESISKTGCVKFGLDCLKMYSSNAAVALRALFLLGQVARFDDDDDGKLLLCESLSIPMVLECIISQYTDETSSAGWALLFACYEQEKITTASVDYLGAEASALGDLRRQEVASRMVSNLGWMWQYMSFFPGGLCGAKAVETVGLQLKSAGDVQVEACRVLQLMLSSGPLSLRVATLAAAGHLGLIVCSQTISNSGQDVWATYYSQQILSAASELSCRSAAATTEDIPNHPRWHGAWLAATCGLFMDSVANATIGPCVDDASMFGWLKSAEACVELPVFIVCCSSDRVVGSYLDADARLGMIRLAAEHVGTGAFCMVADRCKKSLDFLGVRLGELPIVMVRIGQEIQFRKSYRPQSSGSCKGDMGFSLTGKMLGQAAKQHMMPGE
jgi:hypothetical protein